jgi:CRISPR/Cas system CMR-associated protein Cmr1 (group 7 of RAMP superfamily)
VPVFLLRKMSKLFSFHYAYIVIRLYYYFWKECGAVKKLTIYSLSLFILLLLSHSALPAEKLKLFEPTSNAIINMDQMHEDASGSGKEDKQVAFIQAVFILLVLTSFLSKTIYRTNRISALASFLTAVFFQSNYVIKSL